MSEPYNRVSPKTENHPVTGVYAQAVSSDSYNNSAPGLFGRYDNVYRLWEDPAFLHSLHLFFKGTMERDPGLFNGIRILDLGCGSGKGLELLAGSTGQSRRVDGSVVPLIPKIGFYTGVDISPHMIQKANEIYRDRPGISFEVGDLSKGLPADLKGGPFQLYFSSYGTLSHLSDSSLALLLSDIMERMEGRTLFVADLLGRYSQEWPCYWSGEGRDPDNMLRYAMSHLYSQEMRKSGQVESFPMRFWGGVEFDTFLRNLANSKGIRIASRILKDRSIFTGRHMDTGEFDPKTPHLRAAVNSLLEPGRRTPLATLYFPHRLGTAPPEISLFFRIFSAAWNELVREAAHLLGERDGFDPSIHDTLHASPDSLLEAGMDIVFQDPGLLDATLPGEDLHLRALRFVDKGKIRLRHWAEFSNELPLEDPRADFFEIQLGHLLRQLERELQMGLGTGHSLLGLYELEVVR